MKKAGFTLVEVIVAIFIFSIVVAGVAGFAIYYIRNYSFSFEETQSVGQAQQALTTMIREIREARSADNGAWPLTSLDDNSFIFYADVTNDKRADRVRYFIEGTELKKGVIEPTQVPVSYPLANEVVKTIAYYIDNDTTPLFTYYNGDWPADIINNPLSPTNRLLNTRYVNIYLRINVDTNTGSQPFELTSGVTIRSLKDNL